MQRKTVGAIVAGALLFFTGCGFDNVGKEAAKEIKESAKEIKEGLKAIDPAGINRLLIEAEKLRKERDEADKRAKDAGDVMAGMIPIVVVGAYKNSDGKPTRVEHIEGAQFLFTNGDGSKQNLRYDVARRAFVRENGRTAAFFFPETRTIAFDGVFWRP